MALPETANETFDVCATHNQPDADSFTLSRSRAAGPASVSDGDTVEVSGQKIRLQGIDAPESNQMGLDAAGKPWSCGQAARDALVKHTEGQTWNCDGSTRYRRCLATCLVIGEDVDRWMVGQGWALSFVRYSHAYDADESSASKAQAGLWAGAFVAPWDWRDGVCETVLGAVSVPTDGKAKLCGQRDLQPNPRMHHQGEHEAKPWGLGHLLSLLCLQRLPLIRP